MTIDDRGRHAAEALRRSVRAQVDADRALAQVAARPSSGGRGGGRDWQRPLGAVAAVVVLIVVVSTAMAVQRRGDPTDESTHDRRKLEDQLPASAIDGKATMRLPVLVAPQAGLHDGQEITVAGRGFKPNELVGVVECGSEADVGAAGIDACQLGPGFTRVLGNTNADTEGVATMTVRVQRFINTEGKVRIDCTEVAERCLVAMASASNYDRSGGSYVLFDGSPAFPTPTLVVTPTSGLAGGQRVTALATGLIPFRGYQLQQCLGERCVLRRQVTASINGIAAADIAVYPSIRDAKGEVACDDRCTVHLDGWGTKGASSAPFPEAVAIHFDPDAAPVSVPPPSVPAPTTTTPDATTTTASGTVTSGPVVTVTPGTTPTTGTTVTTARPTTTVP